MERLEEEVRHLLARSAPVRGMPEIVAAWPAAVGEAIAANAWPARIARDGTLHVATSSSAWALELTLLEQTVRDRLRNAVGDVCPLRLRFAPGLLPERPLIEEGPPERPVAAIGSRERLRAAAIAARIEDEELRLLVARAAAASLARRASDRRVWYTSGRP